MKKINKNSLLFSSGNIEDAHLPINMLHFSNIDPDQNYTVC